MKYYSLVGISPAVNFREASIHGQAPDRGLYFPSDIPTFNTEWIKNLKKMAKADIAFDVMLPYVEAAIPKEVLRKICSETVDFDMPLVQVSDNVFSLELFHGPTMAFKDVGARFMSRCLGYFAKSIGKEITVLVATSGDTGGAVANGFLGVDGVKVVILYPSGRVSDVQELQLTTLGNNISALEVEGNFDDCQYMVKQAFTDVELNAHCFLTSANSINIARWLPQQLYYIYALQQWHHTEAPVISVPSGNFGNIAAGILAHECGLPIKHFIAGCNANDVFTQYLFSGEYLPKTAVSTVSNAMDVGDPSNFVRVLEMLGNHESMQKLLSSFSFDDAQTKRAIRDVYDEYNYLLDPHGAVAFLALKEYQMENPNIPGIILETAHPIKFAPTVESVIGKKLEMPASLLHLLQAKKVSEKIKPDFDALKNFLMRY